MSSVEERPIHETQHRAEAAEKGLHRQFMLKEIFEQQTALPGCVQREFETFRLKRVFAIEIESRLMQTLNGCVRVRQWAFCNA